MLLYVCITCMPMAGCANVWPSQNGYVYGWANIHGPLHACVCVGE